MYAQDVHYSQRLVLDKERNPVFLNDFEGKWQVFSAYRQQWASIGEPFVTTQVNLNRKIRNLGNNLDYFIGAGILQDQSGDVKLSTNQISLSFGASYTTDFGLFEAALSNQWINKSINLNGVTFPEQYDRNIGRFNENLSSQESLNSNSYQYFNWNFGFSWSNQLNDKWKLKSGVSFTNLTEPKESFLQSDNAKNRGIGVQLISHYAWRSKRELRPYISFYRAKGASETLMGSALKLKTEQWGRVNAISPFIYFRTGISRLTDAFIIGSRLQIAQFDLGLSYDVNISQLELATQYKGSFELNLFYTVDYTKLTKRRLPCVRY